MSKLYTAIGNSNPRDLVAAMIEKGLIRRATDDPAAAGDAWKSKVRMKKGRKSRKPNV